MDQEALARSGGNRLRARRTRRIGFDIHDRGRIRIAQQNDHLEHRTLQCRVVGSCGHACARELSAAGSFQGSAQISCAHRHAKAKCDLQKNRQPLVRQQPKKGRRVTLTPKGILAELKELGPQYAKAYRHLVGTIPRMFVSIGEILRHKQF